VEVLIESTNEKHIFSGYTKQYVRTHVDKGADISAGLVQGTEVYVIVESYRDGELYGRIASQSNS
jgi:hypothetical protein